MGRGLRYRWIEPRAAEVPVGWQGPHLVGRLLAQRGIQNESEAEYFLQSPLTGVHDPGLLSNIAEVAEAILVSITKLRGVRFGFMGTMTQTALRGPRFWLECFVNFARRLRSRSMCPIA